MKGFRELIAHQRWAGILSTTFKLESFKNELKAFISNSDIKLFGYITLDEYGRVTYHINRYPRIKYAPLPGTSALDNLLFRLSTFGDVQTDLKPQANKVKVLLALGEEYDDEIMHTKEEATIFLPKDVKVDEVLIYSLSKDNEYQAPAIVIESDIANLGAIYELAHIFKQWRFTVENLENNTIHLVETVWCKDPDPVEMMRTR